jgi:4-amino-4-deoxy-L-arabinose transferase-like glycosyltransferase
VRVLTGHRLAAWRPAANVPRRELRWLAGAIAFGLVLRLVFVYATRHQTIQGDEIEYNLEARFIAAGKWFWTTTPYGIPHASEMKAPGYPAWLGIWYSILGYRAAVVEAIQAVLFGSLTMLLTWMLARRLFGPRVALAAAWLVAIYPFAWQYEVRLYSESIATPLTLACLLLLIERTPTVRRAAATGALIGVLLLVRESSGFMLAAAAVAWIVAAGWRRGLLMTVLTVAVCALVIAPWTYRNYRVSGGLIPISIQDVGAYGTFNSSSAHDSEYPYLWNPSPPGFADILHPAHPLSDLEFRAKLIARTRAYIENHPFSLAEAFFWNGLSRLWDVRRPARALNEVAYEGRSRLLTIVGLAMYYVLLALTLFCLWRQRSRKALVLPLLAIALGASIVFTADSGTRYRAPLEPVIAMLACAAIPAAGFERARNRSAASKGIASSG